jgi:MYXO-CTERM domain-containing protein
VGKAFEYNVVRRGMTTGNAYALAGVAVPFPDDVGVVALVVDSETTTALGSSLDRLVADLVAEGWDVERVAVERADKPEAVRAKLQALRTKHAARFRAAFLFGGVPRAFSGIINPDGHPDHRGAWPADTFYGDLDGTWTDTANLGGEGVFVNNAGDGKFDQNRIPTDLDIAVGRVDMVDMPAFAPADEKALLQRYLDADHAFRTAAKTYGARTFVSDNFGYFSGEAFARIAWRDAYAIYGAGPESGKPIFDALEDPAGYGLAFGCGGGNPTGAGGVGSTGDFAKRAPRAAFFGLFGSYFGDWSYKDNFLRAALASSGGVLATAWFARPWHHIHHLGALGTFGEAFVATANNSTTYDTGSSPRSIHLALLGDPTLRLFVIRAPSGLDGTSQTDGVALAWAASPDADAGYVVYRRDKGSSAPWTRLGESMSTSYVDKDVMANAAYVYRVVARSLKTTGSGTFYLHSPGITADETFVPAATISDAGVTDDGGTVPAADSAEESGCACSTTGRASNGSWLALGALSLVRLRRRR